MRWLAILVICSACANESPSIIKDARVASDGGVFAGPCSSISMLADTFDRDLIDSKWLFDGETTHVVAGELEIKVPSNELATMLAQNYYDLGDGSFGVNIAQLTGNPEVGIELTDAATGSVYSLVIASGTTVLAGERTEAGNVQRGSTSYDPETVKRLQLTSAAGELRWEIADKNGVVTVVGSTPTDVRFVRPMLFVRSTLGTPARATFFRIIAETPAGAPCSIADVADTFESRPTPGATWARSAENACTFTFDGSFTAGVMSLTPCVLVSSTIYDLTMGSVAIEVPQVGDATMQFGLILPSRDMLVFAFDPSSRLEARLVGAGALIFKTAPYDSALHRWWRFRHIATSPRLFWETSADGVTYTIFAQTNDVFVPDIAEVGVALVFEGTGANTSFVVSSIGP